MTSNKVQAVVVHTAIDGWEQNDGLTALSYLDQELPPPGSSYTSLTFFAAFP